ncbi:hypothetical protein CASFOL_038915 [Castilleja foliolosa]|uniref:Uncharacterized protein n=1 Tax=Castilleja foliolosa TaxID=1961234 RepID=A0ABD3BIA1_9LAMI
MGTDDYQGTSAVDDMDEAIAFLTHGKIRKWKEQLPAAKLTSLYSVLHKIAIINWIPSKNSTVITRPQAQLLYRLGTGIKLNFGQMVFDIVTKLAQSTVTGEVDFFTVRSQLLQGDRLVDLPWIDRRSNVIEGGVGTSAGNTSAGNTSSNRVEFSRAEVEAHIARLEAQQRELQVTIDALKASLLLSGQGGEAARAEDEAEGHVANGVGNTSDVEETGSDEETLEAAFARARKGKGKRVAEEEPSPLRRSQRRRN